MVLFAFGRDLGALESVGGNLVKTTISKQVEREYEQIVEALKLNYSLVVGMHKFLHIQNSSTADPTGRMGSLAAARFSEIMRRALEDQESLS